VRQTNSTLNAYTGVILFARQPNSKRAIYFSKVEKEKRFPLYVYSPREKLLNPEVNLLSGFVG
jgi:hypothetical protein